MKQIEVPFRNIIIPFEFYHPTFYNVTLSLHIYNYKLVMKLIIFHSSTRICVCFEHSLRS